MVIRHDYIFFNSEFCNPISHKVIQSCQKFFNNHIPPFPFSSNHHRLAYSNVRCSYHGSTNICMYFIFLLFTLMKMFQIFTYYIWSKYSFSIMIIPSLHFIHNGEALVFCYFRYLIFFACIYRIL